MDRSRRVMLVLLVALAGASLAPAQTRPAPFYNLPDDGVWIEFAWQSFDDQGKKRSGVLRLSSVGRKEVQGDSYRWVEIAQRTNESDRTKPRLRKLLVAEQGFNQTRALADNVQEGFERVGSKGKVVRLSAQRLEDFLHLGIHATDSGFATIQNAEKIEIELGKYVCRHVSIQGQIGSRSVVYHGWLTDDVPLGCARFEIQKEQTGAPPRLLFKAEAYRTGDGARSELDPARSR
jgi:hypothetical protein